MKKLIIVALFLMFAQSLSWAGFGNNESPFSSSNSSSDDEQYEYYEEEQQSEQNYDFESDQAFSRESFSKKGGEEQLMGPPPPRPIPLDGGISVLLIGGIGLGLRRLFGRKSNVS